MEEPPGESVTAEQDRGVNDVAGQSVREQRDGVGKTCREAGECPGVEIAKYPQSEVGDHEELQSAEENGTADAGDGMRPGKPAADGYAEGETDIDDEHQLVEAHEQITGEKRGQRE